MSKEKRSATDGVQSTFQADVERLLIDCELKKFCKVFCSTTVAGGKCRCAGCS